MLEIFVKTAFELLRYKQEQFYDCAYGTHTLALGSSHGDFGFDPQFCPDSFNLCCRSQDLKYSYLLYKNAVDLSPALENLVLFYSVFSPGSVLEQTPKEKVLAAILNYLFDLRIHYDDDFLSQLSDSLQDSTILSAKNPNYYKGYIKHRNPHEYLPSTQNVQKRIAGHLKYNRRHDALPYLKDILDLAQEHKHRVFIVIPPVRSDYRRALGEAIDPLFEPMMQILNEAHPDLYINVMNFMDSPLFHDELFGDSDHLHFEKEGVEILTSFIASTIESAQE